MQEFHNSVAVVMCNRVGKEGNMDFSGESIVVDANGDVLAMADDTEQILYAEIDLTRSREIRSRRPYTGLRRTEWYNKRKDGRETYGTEVHPGERCTGT